MKTFEFDGEKYKKSSNHQKEWGDKIINELNIKENFKILDLGCGDGRVTKELWNIAKEGKIIGIDSSKGMIKTAKSMEEENLQFINMDINNITLNEKFDLIFSNAALHWVKNHFDLLNCCSNLLTENGVIKFNFAGDGNCMNFYSVIKEVMKKDEYKIYFKDFVWPWYMPKVDEYEMIINSTNKFKNISIIYENADRYFLTEEELVGWIDQPSIVPFLAQIPKELKNNFRNLVVEKMINKTRTNDGTYFETFRRINVYAEKR